MKAVIDVSGLANLAKETQKRTVALKGVRAGIKVLLPAARSGAPRKSGLLARAQGTKVAKGRKGKTIAYAVQGARTKVSKMVRRPGSTKLVKAVPSLYDHLVGGGTKPHMVGGRKHPGSKAQPYRKSAYESRKTEIGEAAATAMAAETQKLIAKEAAKLAAKGKR